MEEKSLVIDTSSYSELANDNELLCRFIQRAHRENYIVYFPEISLMESLNGENTAYILRRFKTLTGITNMLGENHVKVSKNSGDIIIDEIKMKGKLDTLPIYDFSTCSIDSEEKIRNIKSNIKQNSDQENVIKNEAFAKVSDKDFLFFKSLQDCEIEQKLKTFKGVKGNCEYIPIIENYLRSLTILDLSKYIDLNCLAEEIVSAPEDHYKYLTCFINLKYYTYWSIKFNPIEASKKYIKARKKDTISTKLTEKKLEKIKHKAKNTVNDITMAAMSAFSNYFITEDKEVIKICSNLENCLPFKAVRAEDFSNIDFSV